jgi:glycosyltransferase involved in cell wall biosynthesis
MSLVIAGTYVPRHDGLATFAADLDRGVSAEADVSTRIVAIDPEGEVLHYGRRVAGHIQQGDPESYTAAVDVVRRLKPDVVSVQHEYGLWGKWVDGPVEDYTVPFIEALTSKGIPVVTTLHTIRPSPVEREKEVLTAIVEKSSAVVVMARMGAMILMDDYGVDTSTMVHIPHGVPVIQRLPRRQFKRRLGLEGRTIVTTLGLLDPRKGIEYAIQGMRTVADAHPEVLYLIAGETHPSYRKTYGEQYRNELRALVSDLGLGKNVRFVNQYLNDQEVVDYLQASDIYMTPYLDRNQITSGTLAFAVGTGKAVVSTPYIHATEALAEGRGLLAEFRSAESLAHCLLLMLDNPEYRREMEARMVAYGGQDAWPIVGKRYVDLFQRVIAHESLDGLLALDPVGPVQAQA